eukprot:Tbor_TRINITY_DN4929_c5_g1::TRINITY_DN4929_c5_g1_i4::g.9722::m.9722
MVFEKIKTVVTRQLNSTINKSITPTPPQPPTTSFTTSLINNINSKLNTNNTTNNNTNNTTITTTGLASHLQHGAPLKTLLKEMNNFANNILLSQEKEWVCPCGHTFRAAGEWIACLPIACEVPSCPNPKYYISGKGRALLEASPGGVRLQEAGNNNNLINNNNNNNNNNGTIVLGDGSNNNNNS